MVGFVFLGTHIQPVFRITTDHSFSCVLLWLYIQEGFGPPLDEIDGAARILDPVFMSLKTGSHAPFQSLLIRYRSPSHLPALGAELILNGAPQNTARELLLREIIDTLASPQAGMNLVTSTKTTRNQSGNTPHDTPAFLLIQGFHPCS